MTTLERRLEALEAVCGALREPRTLLVTFTAPGVPDGELFHLREMSGGLAWSRRDEETERQFLDRAELEAPRNALGVAVLVQNE